MAPNPQAKPKPIAAASADEGVCAQRLDQRGIAGAAKQIGMTRQAVTMKMNQMFSQRQRGIIFIGALKRPLQIPERKANRSPVRSMG